jgi:hypothetical protein
MLSVQTRQLLAHEVSLVQQGAIGRGQFIEPIENGVA